MTAHALERLIGLGLLIASGGTLLVFGVVAWGTRDERRTDPVPDEHVPFGGVTYLPRRRTADPELFAPQWPTSPARRVRGDTR